MEKKSVVERLIERMEQEKKLVSNYDYISWLEKFTLLHESFADNSWLYSPGEISKEDLSNVENLCYFFNGITDGYCQKYYINTDSHDDFERECIHIKYNNVGYQIGLVVGQGSYVYVNREEPKDDAIEFCNVVNDIKPEDFETKESLLKEFESVILAMKNANISKLLITNVIAKYYK